MTPWQYLEDLVRSDRSSDMGEDWMTARLQISWPGDYHVEKTVEYQWQYIDYKIVFDNPADETLFRLKYS